MLRATLWCMLLLACGSTWADWEVRVEWDPMTDKRNASAWTITEDGHRFGFWFPDDGGVRATLSRGAWAVQGFHEQLLPQYRVDREPPVELLNANTDLQVKIKGDAMGWQASADRSKPSAELRAILSGKRLLVRYFDGGGQQHDVSFTIDGADRAYKLAAELQQ